MTRLTPQVEAKLEAVYALLPELRCRGLCAESCGPIVQQGVLTVAELVRMQRAGGKRTGRQRRRPDVCPYLSAEGRCDVYAVRPLICRLWGIVPKMACPYGCVPARALTDDEAHTLLVAALKVGGRMQVDYEKMFDLIMRTVDPEVRAEIEGALEAMQDAEHGDDQAETRGADADATGAARPLAALPVVETVEGSGHSRPAG